jgi:malate dehydrogenase (oxaloacetate-decarboxylating)
MSERGEDIGGSVGDAQDGREVHRGGVIRMKSHVRLDSLDDYHRMYSPGVAAVVQAIEAEPSLAWELSSLAHTVGIFTNATRVLSFGAVTPLASLPVMEAKAALYDRFVGLSAIPILVETQEPHGFVAVVERIAAGFGGIHLEDIRSPDCFVIEELLSARLARPVMHDDQHGTATAALAAIIRACQSIGLEARTAVFGIVGVGAAGSAVARLLKAYGSRQIWVHDPNEMATRRLEAFGIRPGSLEMVTSGVDVIVAATGRPGSVPEAMIRHGQVVLALSNPEPDIHPGRARAAGAAVALDGGAVNNALAFPGLFRGALDARSRTISPDMMIAAAETIAAHAGPGEVVPSPLRLEVHAAVAKAVTAEARTRGLANTAAP